MKSLHSDGFNSQFDLKDHNILIVDDNPNNLAVIVDYLEDSGLNILVSQDGDSSLKRAKYAKPSIILLDVLMPGIDGYETCRLLKQDSDTRDIPVIFMTALSSIEDKIKGFEVGAVDYVTKPIQPEEVLARIKLHLGLRYMTQTLARQNSILQVEIEQRKSVEKKLYTSNLQLQQKIKERNQAQQDLKILNEQLESRVEQRTNELKISNQNLNCEIIDRKKAEAQVRKSLQEKELLLKEIHHRVKNNLLVVSNLLDFQTDYIEDQELIKMFENSQHRIQSIALIHEHLYNSSDLKKLNLSEYIISLIDKLSDSYETEEKEIHFLTDIDEIYLNIETAQPCGLIINELIANALEHGFREQRRGTIWLSFKKDDQEQIILTVTDNGIGFPENLDFQQTESLGLQLVCTLTKQLEGTINLNRTQGTSFTITFTELDYNERVQIGN
ncbi:MAG: response regulator [Xenococcus sp. (in: cyanobacteria)]